MNQKPIIALDMPSWQEVQQCLSFFPKQESLFLKVGMELFYQEGPSIIYELKAQGHQIFLDLKLHDIPNTVYRAMKNIARLDVDITSVHAAGGLRMMEAALEGLEAGSLASNRPMIFAITQLTSTSEADMQKDQRILLTLQESVLHYASCAHQAGLDGVVASALEVSDIKKATNSQFLCLTPGIRPNGMAHGDQARVVTPKQAKTLGSDYIVVGRPIIEAKDPYHAYKAIQNDWSGM